MATVFQGYRETAEQIDARWRRLQANPRLPAPKLPALPTLAECLEMESDLELVRRDRIRQRWADLFADIDELREEVSQR